MRKLALTALAAALIAGCATIGEHDPIPEEVRSGSPVAMVVRTPRQIMLVHAPRTEGDREFDIFANVTSDTPYFRAWVPVAWKLEVGDFVEFRYDEATRSMKAIRVVQRWTDPEPDGYYWVDRLPLQKWGYLGHPVGHLAHGPNPRAPELRRRAHDCMDSLIDTAWC